VEKLHTQEKKNFFILLNQQKGGVCMVVLCIFSFSPLKNIQGIINQL
jgi:hypothetical protein